jgi:membrane protease YdiL (CAAX protease family)
VTVVVASAEPAAGVAARAPALPLVMFFLLAYGLSWAWWLPIALDGGSVERGDAWPTQLPGLLGPLVAALVVLAVTEGRAGVRPWLAAMVRWPRERRWQLAAVAPLGFLALGVGVVAVTGDLPPAGEFIRYSGTAANAGVLAVAIIVNVFGEEAGWRGYALPRLQSRLGPMRATLLLAALWAGWHAPLFLILASYGDFGPFVLPGFFIGLTAGALVLTALYNHTSGSILVVAVWHASYNLAAATAAVDGLIAAIATTCVIVWAVSLVLRERDGRPALGCPRAPA